MDLQVRAGRDAVPFGRRLDRFAVAAAGAQGPLGEPQALDEFVARIGCGSRAACRLRLGKNGRRQQQDRNQHDKREVLHGPKSSSPRIWTGTVTLQARV